MKLVNFSVNKPVTTLMITLIVVVLGCLFFTRLGLDLLPEIEYPVVSIITTYKGVASKDIEDVITKPIEDTVSTVKDVKSIKSFSQEGISAVMVEFNWRTNIDFAAQDVRDKIGLIEDFLPEDSEKPLVVKLDITAMPVLGYGVTSKSLDTLKLKKILEDNIKDKLERLEGVASVDLKGGWQREILVKINKDLLESYGLSQDQIVQTLRRENINLSGGFIKQNQQELSMRTVGQYQNTEEIKNEIVAVQGGVPIYLKDIAEVLDTHKEQRSYGRTNKKDSILLLINKASGSNTSQIADAVKKELPRLKEYLPQDVEFRLVMDQSHMIKTATRSVIQSAVIGGLLAAALIFLFLRNWRPTFAIILAIPLSLIATFIPLYIADYTLNLMTLGGLALGIGMLVDNAVVVIENIYRHLEKGKNRKESAILGASEVGMAITASTLTTIAVFFPMVLGSGIAGQLSRGLALTVVFALFSSLFVALSLVPMLASKIFNKQSEEDIKLETGKNFKKIQEKYKKILKWSLNHRKLTIIVTVGLLIASLYLIPLIGTEFMPSSDQSIQMLQIKMPVGTSLEETNKIVAQIEGIVVDIDDLISITSFIGLNDATGAQNVSMGFGAAGTNEAQIMMYLKDKKERKMSSEELHELVRNNLPKITGLEVNFMDMSAALMGGANKPIEIKVFGKDLLKLKQITNNIFEKIIKIEGVRDIESTLDVGKPELTIKIDRERASHLGLSIGQIGSAVKNSMQGIVATQLRQGGEETDIRVRYAEDYRSDIKDIENLTIVSPVGVQIPLKQVARISKGTGPVKIDRENHLRIVSVSANVVDKDIGNVVKDIKAELINEQIPEGYFIEYGGSYKQMQDTFKTLGAALLLAILLIYMVMASQFESLVHPFIVMFELPLAFIGVALALLLTGENFSLPSMMGVIILAGIVVNNAIVLIDYVNQLRSRGVKKHEALIQAGTTRLRPIVITSATTILGMLPMALAAGEGAEMMRPMAVTVVGGLIISTVLTLIVIPVIYSLTENLSQKVLNKLSLK